MDDSTAIVLITQELARSRRKHPSWPGNESYGFLILAEEFGEAAKELVEITTGRKDDVNEYIKEVVQTAAMTIRILTKR